MYSDKFTEALQFAAQTHRTQHRKSTQIPYIGHLLGVASIVIDALGTEEEAIAALLHDAPEDQGGHQTLREIRERFGDRVAAIIEGCSDEHLQQCGDKSVYLVSAADKLHNARATLADFRTIGNKVWDRFNAGREATLQNYENLVAAYRSGPPDERRTNVVNELAAVIAALRSELSAGASREMP